VLKSRSFFFSSEQCMASVVITMHLFVRTGTPGLSSDNRFDINDSSDGSRKECSLQDQHEPASNISSSSRLDIGQLWPSWLGSGASSVCLSLVQYGAAESQRKLFASQAMTTKSRTLPRFFFWRSPMTLGAPPGFGTPETQRQPQPAWPA
jgi:hypothetical protein